MELKGKKMNVIGDSITQGVGVKDKKNTFVNRLYVNEGFEIVRNYGISGTRIARQSLSYGPDKQRAAYCDRYVDMDDDADIIAVFGGTNDYGHGNAPIGKFSDRCETTYYGACHALMSGLITKYPSSFIFIMTPLHRSNDSKPSPLNGKPLSLYVDILKEVAAYYALPVLDLYTMSGIQPDHPVIKEKYCPDGLHPNDAGHKLIADRMAGFLKSM